MAPLLPVLLFLLASIAFVLLPWVLAFALTALHDFIKYRLLGVPAEPDPSRI